MRWLLPLLLVVGCYSPTYRDCEVTCASGQCPAGLRCEGGVCRLPGMTAACGVSMGDVPPDGSRDTPLEQLAELRLRVICEYQLRCGATEAVETCIEMFQSLPLGLSGFDLTNAEAAVAAGKAVYHPDKAAECLQAIESLSCDRTQSNSSGPLACAEIFSGTLDAGATCAIGETCLSQNCMTTSCTNQCCTGACLGNTPPSVKQVGQPCTYRDRCTDGYCDTTNPNGSFCLAYKTQGQTCTYAGECGPGMTCRTLDAATGPTCQPPVENLGACNSNQDCRLLSDVCSAGTCVTGGLEGFACPMGTECQTFHSCNSGECALPPAIGDPCASNQSCRTGYCDGISCVPELADDMPCDPTRGGADCESGFCDTSQPMSVCRPRPVCY